MRFGLSEQTLQKIIAVFKGYPNLQKAVLYGSRAKGTYRPGSDIDITLLGGQVSDRDYLNLINELDDLNLPYTFDLSLYHHLQHEALRQHIDRVGVELYVRGEENKQSKIEGN